MLGIIGKYFPEAVLIKIGVIVAVFLVGYATGNVHATQRALQEANDRTAREMAVATNALIVDQGRKQKLLGLDAEKARLADDAAHQELNDARGEIVKSRDAALAQLEREKKRTKEIADAYLSMVDTMVSTPQPTRNNDNPNVPNDPPCGWSGDARRLLDAATGATGPNFDTGIGTTETRAPGRIAEGTNSPPDVAFLKCDDLYRGYVALGGHDQEMRALVLAWQAWYKERIDGR